MEHATKGKKHAEKVALRRYLHSIKLKIMLNVCELLFSILHSRRFNVRFLGVPEQDGENCVKLGEKLLLNKFHVGGSPIENAHCTGKAVQGHPRHAIARFYSRVTRMDVLRTARAKLNTTKIRIVDDLTQEDLREKNRVRPLMNELYKRQQRPSFRNGRLYADGKEVALDVINAFLGQLLRPNIVCVSLRTY